MFLHPLIIVSNAVAVIPDNGQIKVTQIKVTNSEKTLPLKHDDKIASQAVNNHTTTWSKTYGGPNRDQTRDIVVTRDGGFIIAGESKSFSEGNDIWVIKLDKDGDIQWQKRYNGWGYEAVETHSIRQTLDDGYILAGQTDSFGAKKADIWILKLDKAGDVEWQKRYGGDDIDRTRSIQQTPDEGFIVTGKTHSFGAGTRDFWVIKLDKNGEIEWQKTYGGADFDVPRSIQLTSEDGGYIIAGWTKSFGVRWGDFWIVKLDKIGEIEWQKTYGGIGFEEPADIQQTPDGGYLIFEETWSFTADPVNLEDAWVVKLDKDGNIEWQKTYGGNGFDEFSSLSQTLSGKYILAGQTNSTGAGSNDTWVVQLDNYGNVEWQNTYGGPGTDEGESMQPTSDGGYVIAGRTNSFGAGSFDIWVIKIDREGRLYGCNNGIDLSVSVAPAQNMTIMNSTGLAGDTNASVFNTTAVAVDTNATVHNTNGIVNTQCEGIGSENMAQAGH